MLTFLAVLLIVPLLSGSWIGRRIHSGHQRDIVGTNMQKLSGVVGTIVTHRKLVGVLSVVATVGLLLTALTLTPDDRLAHRVPNGSSAYQSMLQVDREFGGTRFAQVKVSWTGSPTNEEIWDVVGQVDQAIAAQPLFSPPISVHAWLSILPARQSSNKLVLAKMTPEEFHTLFWQPKQNRTLIVTRVQDLGVAKYEPIVMN
jgi:predicted RND superfamily exporter protein